MKYIVSVIISITFLFASFSAEAQEDKKKLPLPVEKMGVGVKINQTSLGGVFTYSLKEFFHLGTGAALGYQSATNAAGDDGSFIFYVNPFARYIMGNKGNLFPYGELNLEFSDTPVFGTSVSQSRSLANIELGGFWFPYNSVSVRGGVKVIRFDIDQSSVGIGVLESFIGIDWWLD